MKFKDSLNYFHDYAVAQRLEVINTLTPDNSEKCYAWDGEEILA